LGFKFEGLLELAPQVLTREEMESIPEGYNYAYVQFGRNEGKVTITGIQEGYVV